MPNDSQPGRAYDVAFGALIAITLPLLAARIIHAAGHLDIPNRAIDFITSIATAAAMLAALTVGWRRSVLRYRAHTIDLNAQNQRLRHDLANAAVQAERLEQLAEAVRQADQQGEVNSVRLNKLIKLIEDQRNAQQETQPIAQLRSIKGHRGA